MTANREYVSAAGQSESGRHFLIRDRHGQVVYNDKGEKLVGLPLDGQSIVKREFGKKIYGFELAAGPAQLAHPEISAAVEHTGEFWKNPYRRTAVSMGPIMAVIYASDPQAAGDYVRRAHQGIHGKDHQGRNFNALSPDAFYWAHDTFKKQVENSALHYSSEPFIDTDNDQLQDESNTWYNYYNMPMGMVPEDYHAYLKYRKDMVDNVLEMTPAFDRAINMALDRNPPRPEAVPKKVWALAKVALTPVTELMSMLTIGELPEDIRQRFDIPFSEDDQKRLDDFRDVARTFLSPLPAPVQYLGAAYDDRLRENNGKHENFTDRLSHAGISAGTAVVKRTVLPALSRAQSAWSQIAA